MQPHDQHTGLAASPPAGPAIPEYTSHPPPAIMTRDEKSSSPPPFGSTSGVALLSSPIQEDKPQLDNVEKQVPATNGTAEQDTPIIVRLSIARDVKVRIPSTAPFMTVQQLRTRLYEHNDLDISSTTHTIRFIHLGKILKDTTTIQPIQPDSKCKNSSEAVFVNDGGIIQALLSRSS